MADITSGDTDEQTDVSDDYFEHEEYLSGERTTELLRAMADQIEAGSELTISGADWTIPFEFQGPVEVEVEYEPGTEAELEIEFEFAGAQGDGTLSVE